MQPESVVVLVLGMVGAVTFRRELSGIVASFASGAERSLCALRTRVVGAVGTSAARVAEGAANARDGMGARVVAPTVAR